MKKSQRLRFHELARRQSDLNTTEAAELAELHALAIKHNDPSRDVDDLPKAAAPKLIPAVSPAAFAALEKRVEALEAAAKK